MDLKCRNLFIIWISYDQCGRTNNHRHQVFRITYVFPNNRSNVIDVGAEVSAFAAVSIFLFKYKRIHSIRGRKLWMAKETHRMYAHSASTSKDSPFIKLQKLANVYIPNSPKMPLRMYMETAITKNTVGVRAALKIFLLSLCALKFVYASSKSISNCSRYFCENSSPPIFRFDENYGKQLQIISFKITCTWIVLGIFLLNTTKYIL